MDEYLHKIDWKTITEEEKEQLDTPITKEEIQQAIDQLKPGKSPGPDGFMAKFYNLFKEEVIPWLQEIMNNILEGNDPLKSWHQAIISLIPKDDAECPDVKNFRPISLLNVDYKIFTKVISERLKGVLNKLIGEDQGGFLPGCNIRDNIRMVLNIIEFTDKQPDKKIGLFFLDAEKVFANINWSFMKQVLKKMNFGVKFNNIIEKIYSTQSATIRVNENQTEEFLVQKGTRQGCPLSPLSFILVLEVLLREIQNTKEISGIKIKNFIFKLRAFVDDIVFFVEDPKENLQKVLGKFHEFGQNAGFYINNKKKIKINV